MDQKPLATRACFCPTVRQFHALHDPSLPQPQLADRDFGTAVRRTACDSRSNYDTSQGGSMSRGGKHFVARGSHNLSVIGDFVRSLTARQALCALFGGAGGAVLDRGFAGRVRVRLALPTSQPILAASEKRTAGPSSTRRVAGNRQSFRFRSGGRGISPCSAPFFLRTSR